MKLSQYIKALQEYLENNPDNDLEVVMTQSGYYADGEMADLYDVPEIYKTKSIVLSLGHSYQSY